MAGGLREHWDTNRTKEEKIVTHLFLTETGTSQFECVWSANFEERLPWSRVLVSYSDWLILLRQSVVIGQSSYFCSHFIITQGTVHILWGRGRWWDLQIVCTPPPPPPPIFCFDSLGSPPQNPFSLACPLPNPTSPSPPNTMNALNALVFTSA